MEKYIKEQKWEDTKDLPIYPEINTTRSGSVLHYITYAPVERNKEIYLIPLRMMFDGLDESDINGAIKSQVEAYQRGFVIPDKTVADATGGDFIQIIKVI